MEKWFYKSKNTQGGIMDKLKRHKGLLTAVALVAVVLLALFGSVGVQFNSPPQSVTSPTLEIGNYQMVLTIGPQGVYAAVDVDYTCDGTDDDVQFQQAIDVLPVAGGKIRVLAGTYNFTSAVSRAIDDVTFEGVGMATNINRPAAATCIDAGIQNNWVFRDLRFTATALDVATATDWSKQNVLEGADYRAYQVDSTITGDEWEIPTGRGAMFSVAASNSSAISIAQADYVCDGVADQVQIQAAIDALPAIGGRIHLTEGQFRLSDEITMTNKDGIVVEGAGRFATLTPTAGTMINQQTNNKSIFVLSSCVGVTFRDFSVSATTTIGTKGFSLVTCNNIVFNNLYLMRFDTLFDLSAECTEIFWDLVQGGQGTTNYGIKAVNGQDLQIINCFFPTANDTGISIYLEDQDWVSIIGNSMRDSGFGIKIANGNHIRIIGNTFGNLDRPGIVLLGTSGAGGWSINRVTITGNTFDSSGGTAAGYERSNIFVDSFGGRRVDNIIITNNTFKKGGVQPFYGIVLNGVGWNCIRDNILYDGFHTTAIEVVSPTAQFNYSFYEQHSDVFMDVLAVSATHVRNNEDLSAGIPITFTIDAQPDVPRTLSGHFDAHANITEYDIVITGVSSKGTLIVETLTEADGWDWETNNAYATITSIVMTTRTGTGVGDTMDIGITDVLGLSNMIYEDTDVYKIKKNNADALVAIAQVEETYDTYDMAVIGLAATDDFTIWFRSSLNLIY